MADILILLFDYRGNKLWSPDQGHDGPCRRDVGRVFLAGVRPDSPSRRRIPSYYRPGPGRGVVVELGQRGAH